MSDPLSSPKVPCQTSAEDIKAAFPNTSDANAQKVADLINKYEGQYGIDTDIKLDHFIAQACHELGDLNSLTKEEGEPYFNYQVPAILRCWPKKFSQTDPTKRDPDDYAGTANFNKVLNFTCTNINGNGNESSGDGYKYRGRGPFQLTGKNNYKGFQDDYNKIESNSDIDLIANPDLLLSNPDIAIQSAMWYYKTEVLNKIDVNTATVSEATYKINKAGEGLTSRKAKFSNAKANIDCNNENIITMKTIKTKYCIITAILMLINLSLFSQDASIIGTWKSEEDSNSEMKFLSNNMCYRYYSGVLEGTYSWTISNTSPQCGVTVPVDATTSYLQLKGLKYNDVDCFIINGILPEYMSISPVDKGGVILFDRINTSGSFTIQPGYTLITSSITNYGSYASFYLVFFPTSTMSVGTSYRVATVSENCRPLAPRVLSLTAGSRTWSVTINPNGDVYATIVSGSAIIGSSTPTNDTVVPLATLTYNF